MNVRTKEALIRRAGAFDGSLRAQNVEIDTIQYGTNPISKLVYPEKKLRGWIGTMVARVMAISR